MYSLISSPTLRFSESAAYIGEGRIRSGDVVSVIFFSFFFVDVLTRLSFSRTPSSRPVSWTNKKTSHCVVSDVTSYNKCPFVRDVVYFFREVVLSVLGCIKKTKLKHSESNYNLSFNSFCSFYCQGLRKSFGSF